MHIDGRDGPRGRPFRRTRARRAIGILLIGSCLTIGACGGGGATGGAIPTPTQTSIPVYTLGKRAPTARGYVVVYAYDANVPATATRKLAKTGDRFVAFDVQGCASVRDRASPVFSPALFYLQVPVPGKRPSPFAPVQPVHQPALRVTALAPGGCARGWVTFEIPRAAKPQFVLFHSKTVVAWRLR